MRKKIMEGSPMMPGFQYTLTPAEVDQILAYLKTVTKEAVTPKPASQRPDANDD